jgi:membrane associated rhomboid family serine protease
MSEPEEPGEPDALDVGPRRYATLALVGLNVLVAISMMLAGSSPFFATPAELREAGAVDAVAVWHGEIWRLLTACFIHVGVWHLGLNMWVMWQVGQALEEMIGSARTALIYGVSGVFGFAVSVVLQPRITTGASGAVFGIVGALIALALLVKHKKVGRLLLSALVPFVAATILLGVLVPMVDNTAHVGGLVMGFVLAWALHVGDLPAALVLDKPGAAVPADDGKTRRARVLGLAVLGAAAVVFALVVAYAGRPIASPRYHVLEGLDALNQGKLDAARDHARRASALAPDDAATLVLAGRLLLDAPGADGAIPEGAAVEGVRALEEAIRRYGDTDPSEGFDRAVLELSLANGDSEMPYTDARSTWALCRGALAAAGTRPAPNLKNNCAWLLVKTSDPRVRDPQAALALARAAVDEGRSEDGDEQPEVVHTLAVALSETGDAKEGLALLERLTVKGKSLGSVSLEAERARLSRMAAAQQTE